MLPANLYFKDLYDSTVEFFTIHSPSLLFGRLVTEETAHSPPGSRNVTPAPDFARLARECILRERLDAHEHRHITCSCHPKRVPASGLTPSAMRREVEVAKNELARSQADAMKLEERCRMLEKTLRETKELLKARDVEIEKLRRDRDLDQSNSDRRRNSQDRGESRDSRHGRGMHHRKPSAEKREGTDRPVTEQTQNTDKRGVNRRTVARSARSSESSIADDEEDRAHQLGLEVFLTKTDGWSGAQVIQAVQDLNSEILQFAASSTDMCSFPPARSPSLQTAQALQDTTTRLGPHLTRILSTKDHAQDPLLVQLALQGCISMCIVRAMSSFCIGLQPKSNDLLSQIHSHMQSSEPQPTASRWRALTHRFVHTLHPGLQDYATNELVDTIFRWSLDVFSVAGSLNTASGISLKDSLRLRFNMQVERIARAVCKLAQVTKEEIMSTNFEVLAIDHGGKFDGKKMADLFGDYGTSCGTILCTTELGLGCTTRRGSGEVESGEKGGTVDRRILLQPKVVLESVVDVLYRS